MKPYTATPFVVSFAIALCTMLVGCGNREAAERRKQESAIVAGTGTAPSSSAALTPEGSPIPSQTAEPPRINPLPGQPRAAENLSTEFERLKTLVADCAPGLTTKQCAQSISVSHRAALAASEDLRELVREFSECRVDITPATCMEVVSAFVADLKALAQDARLAGSASTTHQQEQSLLSEAVRQDCEQTKLSLNGLRAMSNPRPGEIYSQDELHEAQRLIPDLERRMAAANCP